LPRIRDAGSSPAAPGRIGREMGQARAGSARSTPGQGLRYPNYFAPAPGRWCPPGRSG
jgi:hypothetical protein